MSNTLGSLVSAVIAKWESRFSDVPPYRASEITGYLTGEVRNVDDFFSGKPLKIGTRFKALVHLGDGIWELKNGGFALIWLVYGKG